MFNKTPKVPPLLSFTATTKHDEHDKEAPLRCDPLHIRYSAPSRDLHIAPLLFLLLLRKPPPPISLHSDSFIHLYHILYIYIYILFLIFTQLGLCYFWALDLERLLRGASFAWWWCNLIGHIKPAGSLCGVLGAYFDCCSSFHFHFLFA